MSYRAPIRWILVGLACLGTVLAPSSDAKAGIKISGGSYTGVGDPNPYYQFSATLQYGSTLNTNDYFIVQQLVGVTSGALTAEPLVTLGMFLSSPWRPGFANPTANAPLIVNGSQFGTATYPAIDVGFLYTGTPITASSGDVNLGTFKIFDTTELPALPGGEFIQNTYASYNSSGVQNGGGTVSFLVTPEPSSLVIVGLVGCCALGITSLRRWRRSA